jgi:hypothetical protein
MIKSLVSVNAENSKNIIALLDTVFPFVPTGHLNYVDCIFSFGCQRLK